MIFLVWISSDAQGVFLHVMADALGSVVVLISAAVIWLTDWEYKVDSVDGEDSVGSIDSVDGVYICLDIYPQDYLDPVLSLVIVVIICVSAWPLLRDSTLVLLNTIPPHIDLGRLQVSSEHFTSTEEAPARAFY